MIPLILVSKNQNNHEEYISDFISKQKILPYSVFRVKPVKDEVGIDQIREIKKETVVFDKNKRLFVIYAFDTASVEAQNAILKTLEEKSGHNQFILLAFNIYHILQTVQSRSKVVKLDKIGRSEIDAETMQLMNKLKTDTNFSFLNSKSVYGINKIEAIVLIDKLLDYYKSRLSIETKAAPIIIRKCLQIRKLIQDNNLNSQLAVDNLLIFINKVYNMKLTHKI